jgi:hypothetical protein
MRSIVAGQHAATPTEFAELALGIDIERFTGPAGPESAPKRAARLAAARDILDDLRRDDPDLADYAARLMPRDDTVWQLSDVSTLATGGSRAGKAGYLRLAGLEPGRVAA